MNFLLLQVLALGLFRLIAIGYLWSFNNIVEKCKIDREARDKASATTKPHPNS